MMYGYGGWSPWGWLAIGIVMLLFWGGLITVVVLLVRGPRGPRGGWGGGYHQPGPDDPERILAQRFARGEIDDTEYRARIDVLRQRH